MTPTQKSTDTRSVLPDLSHLGFALRQDIDSAFTADDGAIIITRGYSIWDLSKGREAWSAALTDRGIHVFPVTEFATHPAAQANEAAPGRPLELRAEPNNRSDPGAIALRAAGKVIGYVPREHQKPLHELLGSDTKPIVLALVEGRRDRGRVRASLRVLVAPPPVLPSPVTAKPLPSVGAPAPPPDPGPEALAAAAAASRAGDDAPAAPSVRAPATNDRDDRTRPRLTDPRKSLARRPGPQAASATASPTPRAAGWYPDPYDGTRLRWWDGSTWTGHLYDIEQAPAKGTDAT